MFYAVDLKSEFSNGSCQGQDFRLGTGALQSG